MMLKQLIRRCASTEVSAAVQNNSVPTLSTMLDESDVSTEEFRLNALSPGGLHCFGLRGQALLDGASFKTNVYRLGSPNVATGSIVLNGQVFGAEVRPDLLHRVVTWQRASWRRGNAKAKRRGEVKASSRKVRKQKGGGIARAGNSRPPHWRKGGVAHPPAPRDFSFDLPKKVRQMAFRSALSAKFASDQLLVVENLKMKHSGKTKALERLLEKHGWTDLADCQDVDRQFAPGAPALPKRRARLLFVADHDAQLKARYEPNKFVSHAHFALAAGNLPYVNYISYRHLHVYNLLFHDRIIMTERAVHLLNDRVQEVENEDE